MHAPSALSNAEPSDVRDLSRRALDAYVEDHVARHGYPPVMGAEEDDAADDAADEGADDAADDADEDDDADQDSDEDSDAGDDASAQLASENEALKRQIADERKKRRQAERDKKRRKQNEQRDAGKYEEMYNESQTENAELKALLRGDRFERAVQAAAVKLRFKNPALAKSMLPASLRDEVVDEDYEVDEVQVERELKKIVKTDGYLVNPEPERQRSTVDGDRNVRRSSRGDGDSDEYKFDPDGKMRRHHREAAGSSR